MMEREYDNDSHVDSYDVDAWLGCVDCNGHASIDMIVIMGNENDWIMEVESDGMEAAMPKSGEAEMIAIDIHSGSIDRIVDSRLHEIAQDLTLAGYIVEVDESV